MSATYRAVLHGNRLEWRDKKPEDLQPDHGVEVAVTILKAAESPAATAARGAAMAAALAQLAVAGGPRSFGDAAEWQRDARDERTLPGPSGRRTG